MIKRLFVKFYALFLLIFTGCGGDDRFNVDTSGVQVQLAFVDWNPLISAKNPEKFMNSMKSESKELYKYYLGSMIGVDPTMDSLCTITLDQFLNFPAVVESQKEIEAVYNDFNTYKTEIEEAFKHVKYHYPKTEKITFYLYNSGFNYGVFPVENEIGIGLEMYLGKDSKVISALPTQQFPDYLKSNMIPDNLLPDIVRGYAIMQLIPENKEDDLLAAIIHEGKSLFAMDAFLPEMEDHRKIRYSKDQLQWCFENEKNIWKEIIDNKWLYDSNVKMISQFVNEGPFTAALPQDSPPRAGAWLGWQMVRAYANDHPEKTLKQILEEKDTRKMLRSYKPKK